MSDDIEDLLIQKGNELVINQGIMKDAASLLTRILERYGSDMDRETIVRIVKMQAKLRGKS